VQTNLQKESRHNNTNERARRGESGFAEHQTRSFFDFPSSMRGGPIPVQWFQITSVSRSVTKVYRLGLSRGNTSTASR
jgi:hypothetical protein